jgi:glucan endo-1,3-beta-D-glucosidase
VTSIAPSSSPPAGPFPGLPILNQQRGLRPPFVAPYLIVPIDSSNPNAVIGNQYTAQISVTRSTLFVFNNDYDAGRTCNLVFALPPTFDPHYPSPYTFNIPGGIQLSRLDRPADGTASASAVGGSTPVGSVPQLMPGNKYVIQSGPCEHGLAGYRIDSTGGLDLNFFQMSSPALGLFMEVA